MFYSYSMIEFCELFGYDLPDRYDLMDLTEFHGVVLVLYENEYIGCQVGIPIT